jgi:hypothetical protein
MAKGKKTLFLNFKFYDLVNDEEDKANFFYNMSWRSVFKDLTVKNIQKLVRKYLHWCFYGKISLGHLTPKGLNVRTADKLVLVSVTWAHTIFGFFETFCEHASRTKLRRKKNSYFLDLWIKSYGCLMFQGEVRQRQAESGRGRAGMCWSQPARVDHLHKKWRAGRKNISRKTGNYPTVAGVDPRPAGDRWSPAGPGPPTCGRRLLVAGLPVTSGRGLVSR